MNENILTDTRAPMKICDFDCIFDQLNYVFEKELQRTSAKEIAKLFNRERKTIYNYREGCTFHCDYDFIIGLNRLGYTIKIVPLGGGYDSGLT